MDGCLTAYGRGWGNEPDEAAAHPSRAALTSYLGKAEVDEYDSPTDTPLALQPGDKILLASDGLFGFLDETEIAMLMKKFKLRNMRLKI